MGIILVEGSCKNHEADIRIRRVRVDFVVALSLLSAVLLVPNTAQASCGSYITHRSPGKNARQPVISQKPEKVPGTEIDDLDGDGLPELYIANDFGPDRLLHNRSQPGKLRFALLEGERGFTTPHSRVLGQDSFKSMEIDFGDVNADGWLDMYVSNLTGPYSLYESHFLWLSTAQVERIRQRRRSRSGASHGLPERNDQPLAGGAGAGQPRSSPRSDIHNSGTDLCDA
jgi:hypothetical protein